MKHLLFSILLLTLAGCSRFKSAQTAGSDAIPQDSMVRILVDIHVADAVADQKLGSDKPSQAFTNQMYEHIFQLHHITAAQYKASYKYYEDNPSAMDKLYEQVIIELSKKEAELKKAK